MKRKKILFLIHTLQVGGAEKVLINLVNNMDYNKYDITVMTVVNTGAFRNRLNSNIKYESIIKLKILNLLRKNKKEKNEKSGNLLSGKNKMKKILANFYTFLWRNINIEKIYKKHIKEKYDIEVAFLEGISAKIISCSKNPNSKKISWIHTDLKHGKKTEKFFKNLNEEKRTYLKFDQIVCVSKVVKDSFIEKFGYNEEKVIIKYNPIDTKNIEKKSLEHVDDIKKDKFTFCAIGRLSVEKGFDRLLKIVKKLNDDGLIFDLWIMGVGAEEQKLKLFASKNNINNVKFLGYKSNPYKYLKLCDTYVCSSRTEGFSTTVCESMILEIPTITVNCSGMKELLGNNNEYGIVIENNDLELYKTLKKCLIDKNIDEYKEKLKERKKMFELKKSVNDIEKIL